MVNWTQIATTFEHPDVDVLWIFDGLHSNERYLPDRIELLGASRQRTRHRQGQDPLLPLGWGNWNAWFSELGCISMSRARLLEGDAKLDGTPVHIAVAGVAGRSIELHPHRSFSWTRPSLK